MPPSTGSDLLHAMGKETANVHAGSRGALKTVQRHLDSLKPHWLDEAVRAMHELLKRDLAALRADIESAARK